MGCHTLPTSRSTAHVAVFLLPIVVGGSSGRTYSGGSSSGVNLSRTGTVAVVVVVVVDVVVVVV
eukprot:3260129-Pyramimonas_sp.AAC.1